MIDVQAMKTRKAWLLATVNQLEKSLEDPTPMPQSTRDHLNSTLLGYHFELTGLQQQIEHAQQINNRKAKEA